MGRFEGVENDRLRDCWMKVRTVIDRIEIRMVRM